jgi:hypothetical protein
VSVILWKRDLTSIRKFWYPPNTHKYYGGIGPHSMDCKRLLTWNLHFLPLTTRIRLQFLWFSFFLIRCRYIEHGRFSGGTKLAYQPKMLCTNWGKHQTHSLQAWKTRFWQTWNAKDPKKVRFPYFLYLLFQEQNFINANSIQYLTGKSNEYDQDCCCCFSFVSFFIFFQSSDVEWMATIRNKIESIFHIEVKLCPIFSTDWFNV